MSEKRKHRYFSDYLNEMAQTYLSWFMKEKKDENIVFSPISIFMLLVIAAYASAGRTRSEIGDYLRERGRADEDHVLAHLAFLQHKLMDSGSFTSANAVCVQETIRASIVPDFEKLLKNYLGGSLFATRDIVRDVNAWVSEKTRGMITQLADESMTRMLACLMNAVSFESEWLEPYGEEDISEGSFTNADRSAARVPMLSSTEHTYYEDEQCIGFRKPYRDEQFSFWAWLPRQKGRAGLKKTVEGIDFSQLEELAVLERVIVTMPEFTYDFSEELTELCRQLGIRTMFTPDADFSPMTSESLMVDSIVHKAHIEVDRKGTRAAAATAAFMVKAAAVPREPKVVCLDRSFIYAVVNTETGLPAFVGVCSQLGE